MGDIFSAITGAVGGFFTGGLPGAVIGGARGFLGGGTATTPTTMMRPPQLQGKPLGQVLNIAGRPPPPRTTSPVIPARGSMMFSGSAPLTALQTITESTGRRIPASRILEIARVCGLEIAAETLGVDVSVICRVVLERRRRRSRGISAADLRRTSSTIRKINTMSRRLSELCGPVRRRSPARRRAS